MMRVGKAMPVLGLVVCLLLPGSTDVAAQGATKPAKKDRKKARDAAAPGRASGVSRTSQPDGGLDAGAKLDTIREYRNEHGETVYVVSASRSDISPPLFEMAAHVAPVARGEEEELRNPLLPSYRLQSSTLNAGGAPSASAAAIADGSFGQELAVGVSSAPHFILQSGFWSVLGSTLVPVVLGVDKVLSQPGAVGLSWSGNAASYDVYRTTSCATVFSGVFAVTSNNAYSDGAAPASGLACYNVLAYAPGPPPPDRVTPSP